MSIQAGAIADVADVWLSLLRALALVVPEGCVWKNADRALEGDGDIDYCAPLESWREVRRCFEKWASEQGLGPVIECRHFPEVMFLVAVDPGTGLLYELDVKEKVRLRGGIVFRHQDIGELLECDPRGFLRLRPGAEGLVKLVIHGTAKGGGSRPPALVTERIEQLLRRDLEGATKASDLFGVAAKALLKGADAVLDGRWDRVSMTLVDARTSCRALASPKGVMGRLRKRWIRKSCPVIEAIVMHGRRVPGRLETWLGSVATTHPTPGSPFLADSQTNPRLQGGRRGAAIGIVGPDGVGKSTLIESLMVNSLLDIATWHVRSPGLLYRRNRGGGPPVTAPHAEPAYGVVLSTAKAGYLFIDYFMAWFLRIRPHLSRGGWLIVERGWWDMAVDPLRYRLSPAVVPWIRFLGRLLPQVDLMLVLKASGNAIHSRKQELDPMEIDRQIRMWEVVLPRSQKGTHLDATKSSVALRREAAKAIEPLLQRRDSYGWTSLPSRRRARWRIPRAPRSVAANALRIYHPVTVKGLVGWHTAKLLSSLGAFRLLPKDEKPIDMADVMHRWLPPGGAVAAASTNHPQRFIVMALAPDGCPVAVAKVALDDADAAELQREAEALQTLGPLLPRPLSVPRLLETSDHLLVEQAIRWRPRLRPWRLPEDVARALGSFFASFGANVENGPTHGDCAPWNLFRTDEGWVLGDWERASERGLPFADVFHYVVQAHALLRIPSQAAVLRGIRGEGWIGRALQAYSESSGMPFESIPENFVRWLETDASTYGSAAVDARACHHARLRLLVAMGR